MLRIFIYQGALVGLVLAMPAEAAVQESQPDDAQLVESATRAPAAGAEHPRNGDPLSRLVAEAIDRNPRLAAARSDVEASRSRISQAGAWEDPVLTLGFMNLPARSFDFADDFMTMKIVRLGQRIPLPGQIGHRRKAAALRVSVARHGVAAARVEIVSAVKRAYAELYYRDRALEIVDWNLAILRGLEDVTSTRYATGVGHQPALLRAGLEIDGLALQRVRLTASRHSALARLNALRNRPAATTVAETTYPPDLLALAETPTEPLAFASALGIGGADPSLASPADLPRLDSLVAVALRRKPELRAHVARIGAQKESVALARAMRWPAPQLSIGYAQRDGFADMVNATVSFRLPIFLGSKQGAAVREEAAVLDREEAVHSAMVAEIERDVTRAYAAVLDALGRLELYDRGILLRSEATFDATLAAYRSGAADFLALLDSQTRLYGFELERHRRLADLLVAWADLEGAVGREIEP